MTAKRVLIGSPIKQKPVILKEFLLSLSELDQEGLELSYLFADDNEEVLSSKLLEKFAQTHSNVTVYKSESNDKYVKDDFTHNWNEKLVWKVARLKDIMIQIAKEFNYDYLFLVDSDIVLNPATVKHLISLEKSIISEVFWTRWKPEIPELPQVWLTDHYDLFYKHRNEILSEEELSRREQEFIAKMRIPGVYEVGGLGACTLLSKEALQKGVNFKEIKNISFWGEDRHFCIRAAALGIPLFVDTHFPAYHIYRDSDLKGITGYKQSIKEKNSSVEVSKAVNIAKQGMEALGTFHYALGYATDWKLFFDENAGKSIEENIQEQKEMTIKNHLKVNAYVEELKYAAYDNSTNTHTVEFELYNYILKQGEKAAEHYRCTCNITEMDQTFKITSFSVEEQLPLGIQPSHHKRPGKITLSMVVKNESDRFLKEALAQHVKYIDSAVIIDDASEDTTASICKEMLSSVKHTIIKNKESKFNNEVELRRQQWEATIQEDPDWILNVDADEVFEELFNTNIHVIVQRADVKTVSFRLYDMWDSTHYREDEYWYAHNTLRPFMIRYCPDAEYEWLEEKQHCGRFPKNILNIGLNAKSDLRLKHLGWSRKEDREFKYKRYQLLDVEKNDIRSQQYESILDENPNLIAWKD
ncbi:glycosyltransferase family 2 protein [Saccharibacillus brassicae]|uniref:Glycosyl transferase n=1 Tax=Saccharibacillus brassicae TaxID=2583377 RepID=A0A4Y6UWQ0_SACBS|nr:glycosyltransferase family 2 protein [Saccharibacillus brassicae]QDH20846.1 glycosyl transferase [Saccharibacillus brassicae]